ncbi:type II toxin-antitoxin system VapC family toxin [Infirmifilum sp. SLHALR2]
MNWWAELFCPTSRFSPWGVREYLKAREFMLRHGLKPSDALHAATVVTHGLQAVASEDSDFDRVGVKRIWVQRP